MIKVLKNRITAWEAERITRPEAMEQPTVLNQLLRGDIDQVVLSSTVMSCKPSSDGQGYSNFSSSCHCSFIDILSPFSIFMTSASVTSTHHWLPVFNGSTAFIFLRDLLQLLGTFLDTWQLSTLWVIQIDSVTQKSFPDINSGSNLNPRNTPLTSILLAVGWDYATNC